MDNVYVSELVWECPLPWPFPGLTFALFLFVVFHSPFSTEKDSPSLQLRFSLFFSFKLEHSGGDDGGGSGWMTWLIT